MSFDTPIKESDLDVYFKGLDELVVECHNANTAATMFTDIQEMFRQLYRSEFPSFDCTTPKTVCQRKKQCV